jgi:hypothetical protein
MTRPYLRRIGLTAAFPLILSLTAAQPATAEPPVAVDASVVRLEAVLLPPDYVVAVALKAVDESLDDAASKPDFQQLEHDNPGVMAAAKAETEAAMRQIILDRESTLQAQAGQYLAGALTADEIKVVSAFFTTPSGQKFAVSGRHVQMSPDGKTSTVSYEVLHAPDIPPDATPADIASRDAFGRTEAAKKYGAALPGLKQVLLHWLAVTMGAAAPRIHEVFVASIDKYLAAHGHR